MRTRPDSRQESATRSFDFALSGVSLPSEILIRILEILPRCRVVKTASLVSKAWLAATRSPNLWHTLDNTTGLGDSSASITNMTKLLQLLTRRQFRSLRTLVPPRKVRMRKKALALIAKSCPLLEEIDVGGSLFSCMKATDVDILSLPALFPRLSGIRLSQWKVTSNGITDFCKNMGCRLTSVRIDNTVMPGAGTELTDDSLALIARYCPNLKHFEYGSYLGYGPGSLVSGKGIIALLRDGSKLKTLSLLNRVSKGLEVFYHILAQTSASLERLFVVNHFELMENEDICARLKDKIDHFTAIDGKQHARRVQSMRASGHPISYWL